MADISDLAYMNTDTQNTAGLIVSRADSIRVYYGVTEYSTRLIFRTLDVV